MRLSTNNKLFRAFRWFNLRRKEVFKDYTTSQIVFSENDATRRPGGQLNICPIARMVFLWGPFVILPAWSMVYIATPLAFLALLAGIGSAVLNELGWFTVTNNFWSMLFGGILGLLFVLAIFIIVPTVWYFLGEGLRWVWQRIQPSQKSVKERAPMREEEKAAPAVSLWLKGLHDKVCPAVTVVESKN